MKLQNIILTFALALFMMPRALPWAIGLLAFQAVLRQIQKLSI